MRMAPGVVFDEAVFAAVNDPVPVAVAGVLLHEHTLEPRPLLPPHRLPRVLHAVVWELAG